MRLACRSRSERPTFISSSHISYSLSNILAALEIILISEWSFILRVWKKGSVLTKMSPSYLRIDPIVEQSLQSLHTLLPFTCETNVEMSSLPLSVGITSQSIEVFSALEYSNLGVINFVVVPLSMHTAMASPQKPV